MSKREDFITEFIMKNPLHIQGMNSGVQLAEQAVAAWKVIEEGAPAKHADDGSAKGATVTYNPWGLPND